jgi:putative hydrolase of the HAD superfamily
MKNFIRQLLIDADDTLWENNIYYLRASNALFDLIAKSGFDRQEIEAEFDRLEIRIVKEMGYGSKNYSILMRRLFDFYNTRLNIPISGDKFNFILEEFLRHPLNPKLFDKVSETIRYLKTQYKVYVLTKGNHDEQKNKLLNAGIAAIVDDYYIVDEKNDPVYRELLGKFGWKAEQTCMIGNSPKSDINPALRCGMYAIFIPYADTWKLDDEPLISADGRIKTIQRFEDLKQIL